MCTADRPPGPESAGGTGSAPTGGAGRDQLQPGTRRAGPTGPTPVAPMDLRAADTDREYVIGQLARAHSEGRIDLGEFDQRVCAAWAARTYGELAVLTADLPCAVPPRPGGVPAPSGPKPAAARAPAHRGLWAATAGVWLAAAVLDSLAWAGAGALISWAAIVLLVAAVTLLATGGHPGDQGHRT